MKKVLIIGNLGYIGPVLENHLYQKYQVYGYDIGFFSNNYSIENVVQLNNRNKAQYFGDVRNFDSELLNDIDKVVYLAAISNDPMGNRFKDPTYDINKKSAINIAAEAKRKGVEDFIFASSCSVYGTGGEKIKDELSNLDPLTNYAKSKINSEIELEKLADDKFKIKCLRFATACGFSPRLRLDLVLNDFVASAILYGKINILSDGTPWRPLINVKDMSRAIEWALNSKGDLPNFLSLNIGSNDWNYTIKDLAMSVKEIIPSVEVSINENADPDRRSYKVDFSKFKKLAPEYTPIETISDTIFNLKEGIKKMQFTQENFRESHFIRLNKLNYLIDNNYIDDKLKLID